jgi:hypothetical protein
MGPGFLGTPASLMLDVVVCSLVLVVPTLVWSLRLARRKRFALHKRVQIALGVVLAVVVVLFEIDMRRQGGFWSMALVREGAEARNLATLLGVHLAFSGTTVVLWAVTLIWAIRKFPDPPAPCAFSPVHKTMAWIAVIDMVMTVATGLMVYYFGFVG